MATGIATSDSTRTARGAVRRLSRPRVLFSLVLVLALFASATSAFGVPSRRFTRVSVNGDTYAVSGLFLVDGMMQGLLGTSSDDGAHWSLGLAPGAFWGATAWGSGPVWGSMTSNRGLWTGTSPNLLHASNPATSSAFEWKDIATDGTNVLAVGHEALLLYGEPAEPATIWKTADGGGTWTNKLRAPNYAPQPPDYVVPTQPSADFESIDATPGLAVAVGVEYPPGDFPRLGTAKQALVFYSEDGGDTWTQVSVGTARRLVDVDVVSSGVNGVVWAAGANQTVYRSLDGGKTWSNWQGPPNTGAPSITYEISGIGGVDANRAYFVTSNGKIGFIDGDPAVPANWTFLNPGGVLNSIAVRDATHAVAVGDDGLFLRTSNGMAGWAAKNVATTPSIGIQQPSGGFVLDGQPVHVAGTSADAGLGVAQVQIQLKRSDGKYWTGSAWDSTVRWLPALTMDNWAHWTYDWTDDGTSKAGVHTVEVWARAVNGNGATLSMKLSSARTAANVVPTSSNYVFTYTGGTVSAKVVSATGQTILNAGAMNLVRVSGTTEYPVKTGVVPNASGVYSYKVVPTVKTKYRWKFVGNSSFLPDTSDFYVTPGVKLNYPKATRSSSTFTVTTYISPKHSSKAVRIYAYRYNTSTKKWSTTAYKYAYCTSYAYSSTTSRMVAKLSLPRGTWRFRAYAPADSYHAATWSSYSTTYRY